MIKVALKHFIYEKCIDVLFNAIDKNFMGPYREFKVGDTFLYMEMRSNYNYLYYVFEGVEIIKIYPSEHGDYGVQIKYMTFTRYNRIVDDSTEGVMIDGVLCKKVITGTGARTRSFHVTRVLDYQRWDND